MRLPGCRIGEMRATGSDLPFEQGELNDRFRVFFELMQRKVRDILLVSTLYDACVMEEDGRLVERIINEYRGLNLSQPPRINWASSAEEAFQVLERKQIDLVISMLLLADIDAYELAGRIKERQPDLPVLLLSHGVPEPRPDLEKVRRCVDRTFVWTGNADLMLALIKSTEDRFNVVPDTESAGVRVILFVEDSPLYRSSLLPVLYKEVVKQIQAVMEQGLNDEHKLLTMRARPKILIAETFEEAVELFARFQPFVLGVISDVRFPRGGRMDDDAGVQLLQRVKRERFDIPLLLTSSDPSNEGRASAIPAFFLNKNSPTLHDDIRAFLKDHLGFGSFVFRMPDGREICRASNMRSLERAIASIPAESFCHHWNRNDFSRWLFARTEIILASKLRPITAADFEENVEDMRRFLVSSIRRRRRWEQQTVVADFDRDAFDPELEFLRIGKGSLGGKGRGLVFLFRLLRKERSLHNGFPELEIVVPQTLIITTDVFESFVENNGLKGAALLERSDDEVADRFQRGDLPQSLQEDLAVYLQHVTYPLAVRSSSILEDVYSQPFAGLYRTCMLPNNDPKLEVRLDQLASAIKLVYASTYFRGARSFARRIPLGVEEDKMAVIVQRLVGRAYGEHFYPALSGVAHSYNYYPFSPMKPEDGIVHMALGLGKTVVEGGKVLRFCPKYPRVLPLFSSVEAILANSQKEFYSLHLDCTPVKCGTHEDSTLEVRRVVDASGEEPVLLFSDAYLPDEHRIREGFGGPGPRVVTFSSLLKYNAFPLPAFVNEILKFGRKGMGCPVEIEFSVNVFQPSEKRPPEVALLQIRPMTGQEVFPAPQITDDEIRRAFCHSAHALGNGVKEDIRDIVFVKPQDFDVSRTREIAREIGSMNAQLAAENRKYLLIGPGRWGSADRWLGIPVEWADIANVEAIVETTTDDLQVEPSQGSHFFHNIASLGINYLMITGDGEDFLQWQWVLSLPRVRESAHVAWSRCEQPFVIKVEGEKSRGVILRPSC